MQNWDINEEIGQCTVEQDYRDAEQISKTIGVPLVRVNFVKEYWNDVFRFQSHTLFLYLFLFLIIEIRE